MLAQLLIAALPIDLYLPVLRIRACQAFLCRWLGQNMRTQKPVDSDSTGFWALDGFLRDGLGLCPYTAHVARGWTIAEPNA